MDIVKIFLLKQADAEPIIINNITCTNEHLCVIKSQLGAGLVDSLEIVVRTLQVLQEIKWSHELSSEDRVGWRMDRVEQFTPI